MSKSKTFSGVHVVCAVDSADRLTLLSSDGVKQGIMLSFITAPKIGRRTGQPAAAASEPGEDPCAYEAFEFVRSQTIGNNVHFEEDFRVDVQNRIAGRVSLSDGRDLALELLKQGLAAVPDRIPARMGKDLYNSYVAAQTTARQNKRGLWAAHPKIRTVKPYVPSNAATYAAALKGGPNKFLIERVITGTTVSVLLVKDPTQQLTVNFTGVTSLPVNRADTKLTQAVLEAAKAHTERMLLHRHVNMTIDGVDPITSDLLGAVVGPKGSFQADMVKRGLARVLPSTITFAQDREVLTANEAEAQAAKEGIWTGFSKDAPAAVDKDGKMLTVGGAAGTAAAAAMVTPTPQIADFEGTVVQVVSGDTFVVRVADAAPGPAAYRRVFLAGVRAQRSIRRDDGGHAGRAGDARVAYEEYTWEARELMRKRVVGEAVKVHVEYSRPADGDYRHMVTLTLAKGGVNVGALLLREGYGRLNVNRNDPAPSCIAELQEAEAIGKAAGVGVHSEKPSPVTTVVELNRVGEKKGREVLAFLQRGMQGRRPPTLVGIVEAVLSGSAFRVYVPRENFLFTLKLVGIATPSTAGPNGEPADPFAAESKDFAIMRLQQREVEVMVEASDRTGSFLGYINERPSGKSFAATAVEAGWAALLGADRALNAAELTAAAAAAQAAKRGIWQEGGAVPSRVTKREAQRATGQRTITAVDGAPWVPCEVTEVSSNAAIYVVPATPETEAQRKAMQTLLAQAASAELAQGKPTFKRGDLILAYYREDKNFYRARVTAVHPSDVEVQFIDFGNTDEVSVAKHARPIPTLDQFNPLRELPPLAVPLQLALLRPLRPDHPLQASAAEDLWEFAQSAGDALAYQVRFTADGGKAQYVALAAGPNGRTAQAFLAGRGVSRVDQDHLAPAGGATGPFASAVLKAQEEAKQKHRGLWEYGDVALSDEEDEQL